MTIVGDLFYGTLCMYLTIFIASQVTILCFEITPFVYCDQSISQSIRDSESGLSNINYCYVH